MTGVDSYTVENALNSSGNEGEFDLTDSQDSTMQQLMGDLKSFTPKLTGSKQTANKRNRNQSENNRSENFSIEKIWCEKIGNYYSDYNNNNAFISTTEAIGIQLNC